MTGTSEWKLTHRPAGLKHYGTRLTTVTNVHHIIISISRPIFPPSSILRHHQADRGWVEITADGESDPELSGPSTVGRAGLQKQAYVPPASFPTSSFTLAPSFLPVIACSSAQPQPLDPALLHIASVIPISPGSKRADLLYIYWVGLMCSHSLGFQEEINYQKYTKTPEGRKTTSVVLEGITVDRAAAHYRRSYY